MGSYVNIKTYREQAEQLEPVFAGLIHDGAITYRDAIALIFYLIDKDILRIRWKPKADFQKIESFEITEKTLPLDYVQASIKLLKKYAINNVINIETVGKLIESEILQRTIQENSMLIKESNITASKVTFYESGDREVTNYKDQELGLIDSHRKVMAFLNRREWAINMMKVVMVILLIMALLQLPTLLSFRNVKITVANLSEFSYAIAWWPVIILLGIAYYYIRNKEKKPSISFTFRNQKISDIAGKYSYLYEFLKGFPLDNNNLNNVFLPYSIAFGLNTHWNDQFLTAPKETGYSKTPLNY